MTTYTCTDGNADIDIEAETARAAAQEYVDGGDWGEITETCWIDVWYTALDDDGDETDESERVTIQIDPDEPDCEHADGHDWQSPHEIVSGIEENPGVWGHGGGVTISECCMRCGARRHTDTWAQRSDTGEQGLESVAYDGPGHYELSAE